MSSNTYQDSLSFNPEQLIEKQNQIIDKARENQLKQFKTIKQTRNKSVNLHKKANLDWQKPISFSKTQNLQHRKTISNNFHTKQNEEN